MGHQTQQYPASIGASNWTERYERTIARITEYPSTCVSIIVFSKPQIFATNICRAFQFFNWKATSFHPFLSAQVNGPSMEGVSWTRRIQRGRGNCCSLVTRMGRSCSGTPEESRWNSSTNWGRPSSSAKASYRRKTATRTSGRPSAKSVSYDYVKTIAYVAKENIVRTWDCEGGKMKVDGFQGDPVKMISERLYQAQIIQITKMYCMMANEDVLEDGQRW